MSELFDRLSNLSPKRLALLAIDLQEQLDAARGTAAEPIAVVGIGCRFPGAPDPDAYWRLLRDGVDAIVDVPASRWDAAALYDPNPDAPGKIATRWGGFLDRVDLFEPEFFGIAPREAQSMDPQQRLLLEVAWEALEHAGIAPDDLHATPTGVYVGICNGDYGQMLLSGGDDNFDMYLATGSAYSIASGRLSYALGLQGPALSVDTACSSSLVAVHLAVQALRTGACSAALAGGVNVILSPNTTMSLSRARMMAADGRCKAFDARADGFVRGEGAGILVLKRLSDAERDGDDVLAVIRGSALNQDGRSNGLTAPNGPAQVAVIRAALADAGVTASDVSYVETHGTGTSLGDPIEVNALGEALCADRPAGDRLLIGSAKTNIGHLESAAGVAGLVKVVLAMQHRQLPPHLHLRERNPYIPWDRLPIDVPTELTPWAPGRALVAGVSSFGFSGTNAHVVLAEAPTPSAEGTAVGDDRPVHVLRVSARNAGALQDAAGRLAARLHAGDIDLADAAATLAVGRNRFDHRLAAAAAGTDEAAAALDAFAAGREAPGVVHRVVGAKRQGVAFLFTGHGSQYLGMGRGLYDTHPPFRAAIDRCAAALVPLMPQPLHRALFEDEHLLAGMTHSMPATFAVQYALAELWRSWGVRPAAVAGHSAGEYVAAVVAGVMTLEEGLRLVAARGRLMDGLPANGSMAAVFVSEERARDAIARAGGRVSIAAVNGPESVALSGVDGALDTVLAELRDAGAEVRPLAVPVAAHSPQVDPMLDEFEQVAATADLRPPTVDVVSGMTGRMATGGDLVTAGYWRRHLRQPVRFADAMQTLYDGGHRTFLEIGPHPTLLGMGRHVLPEHECAWLPSLRKGHDDWTQVASTVADLFTLGTAVDAKAYDGPSARRRVHLPTYPFQRKRYWTSTRPRRGADPSAHPLLGTAVRSPALSAAVYETALAPDAPAFLGDHRIHGVPLVPAPAFVEMALAAARDGLDGGDGEIAIEDLTIREALVLTDDADRTVQTILRPSAGGGEVEVVSSAGDAWTSHATARVTAPRAAASQRADLDGLRASCNEPVDVAGYYDTLDALGVEFGPSFRGLEQIFRGAGGAVGRVELPRHLRHDAAAYEVHPALLDACFHLLGVAFGERAGDAGYLVIGIDRVRVVRSPGEGPVWAHATVEPTATDQLFTGRLRVLGDGGDVLVEAEGIHLKLAGRDALLHAVRQQANDWRYEVAWHEHPAPPTAAPDSGPRHWVVLGAGAGVGERLTELARARGDAAEQIDDTATPAAVVAALAAAGPTARPTVVCLLGLGAGGGAAEDVQVAVEHSVGATVAAFQAAAQAGIDASWWIATRGAQPAGGPVVAPEQAPLWGLGRVIGLEHPERWGGSIDLDPAADPAAGAATLLAEVLAAGEDDQVAVRSGTRLVPRLQRATADDAPPVHCRPDAAYLVTGGLGGLGLHVAEWMAAQGAGAVVLIGRRGLPPRDEWDRLPPDSREAAQVEAIGRMEASGAVVHVIAADVADRGQMAALVARFGADLPPLAGVIHAAAALSNWSIDTLPRPAIAEMLRPKVAGTLLLHELTSTLPLDFLVLFSSTTALWGSRDLGHYAAANQFLDAFAHWRRGLGLPATSINWGTWAEMRVASDAERAQVASLGLHQMPTADALAVLGDLLGTGRPQIAVAAVDWDVLKPVYEARRPRPFLSSVDTARRHRQVAQPARRVLIDRLEGRAPAERRQEVVAFLREQVAQALGMDDPFDVETAKGLFEMGMDSLMSVELKGTIEAAVGVALPSTLTFNYPNVDALADHLLADVLSAEPAAADDTAAAGSTAAPAAPAATIDDDTSEDELARMLAARLQQLR